MVDGVGFTIVQLHGDEPESEVKEVILAISPTMEGDTTAFYITRKLRDFKVRITSIARGVPVGGELEYTDEMTLARSITNRLPVGQYVK